MPVLSTTRCNHCGVRLPEENTAECPSCHRELAEADRWSELKEWRQTRESGRAHYIFRRWVIGWGGLLGCAMSIALLLKGAFSEKVIAIWRPQTEFLVTIQLLSFRC